jgi:hypothetical protein
MLLSRLDEAHAELCRAAGIVGADAVLSAAAVGLVVEVTRNHGYWILRSRRADRGITCPIEQLNLRFRPPERRRGSGP